MPPTEDELDAMDAAERRQHILNQPQPHDDLPIAIPAKRLMKVAAILDATLQGHELYRASAYRCLQYLRVEETEQVHGIGVIQPPARELAAEIDRMPWPAPGPPRAQPDI